MMRAKRIALGVFAAVLVLVFAGGVRDWAPDRPVDALKGRWAPPPSRFVDVLGMQVHLRDEGPREDPSPIVLIHGTSSSLHTWEGWAQSLSGERRVVRFDLPGFGLTGPFPDGNYRMPHYVEFVLAMLDQLHLSHVVLVGNSFGGEVSWQTALAAPGRVDKLILVDSAGYPRPPNAKIPIGFRLAASPTFGWIGEYFLPRGVVESSTKNVYGDPSKVTSELVDRYYELTLRAGNRRALGERFRQAPPSGPDSGRIHELTLPTLILWGKEDHLIPLTNAEAFHRDVAGSTLVEFDGLGHVPHEEDPASTVRAAKQFLAAR